MWLQTTIPTFSTKDELETFLDELSELSPDLFLGPGQGAYLKMRGVHHFWKLSEFLKNKEENRVKHPFYKCLQRLHQKYRCTFFLVETPAEALWIQEHKNPAPDFLYVLPKNDAYYDLLAKSPLADLELWLQDLVENDDNISMDLGLFCDALDYMGIKNLWELHVSMGQKNFLQSALLRFGKIIKAIHARLNGSEDFHMHPYNPPMHLRSEFYPELEKDMSAEGAGEIPARVLDILCKWERRLESRKSFLSGLEVLLESTLEDSTTSIPHPHLSSVLSSAATKKVLRVLFPHPIREASFIHQVFMEKWLSSANDPAFFDAHIKKVSVRSMGLQRGSEHQLHLFDHTDEDVYEEWGLLLGKLYNRGPDHPASVGVFEAQESFVPEQSVRFAEWSPGKHFEIIGEHPRRPLLLERHPKELMRDLPQESFLELVSREEGLRSLEFISESDRLSSNGESIQSERLYAEINDDWVFYDPRKGKLLKHGSF